MTLDIEELVDVTPISVLASKLAGEALLHGMPIYLYPFAALKRHLMGNVVARNFLWDLITTFCDLKALKLIRSQQSWK